MRLLWLIDISKKIGASEINSNESKQSVNSEEIIEEMLLDSHLGITKTLLLFQTSEKKYYIGSNPKGAELINDLVEYFIFPASLLFKKYRDSLMATTTQSPSVKQGQTALNQFETLLASKSLKSICNSSMPTISAFELLVSLSTGCLENLKTITYLLSQIFYPS